MIRDGDIYTSPYYPTLRAKIGEKICAEGDYIQSSRPLFYGAFYVGEGLIHACKSLKSAKNIAADSSLMHTIKNMHKSMVIMKCIIPKGTKYVISAHKPCDDIAAKEVLLCEIIP